MSVRLQKQPFDIGAETFAFRGKRTDVGALVAFVGFMREVSDGHHVRAMEIEHFPGVANEAIETIERKARKAWPLLDCLIVHRYGLIKPGEPIVLVLVLSQHRVGAFSAAEFIMDHLKSRAPFWKAEHRGDGEKYWVEAKACDEKALSRWSGVKGQSDSRDRHTIADHEPD